MGYTHYWALKPGCNNPEKFAEAIDLFKKCWEKAPKTFTCHIWDNEERRYKTKRVRKDNLLFDGDGTGNPTSTKDTLCFNGNAKYCLDHETFRICLADFADTENSWSRKEGGSIWDFCKTAEKPYDLAVCLALLSFKEVFGDDFEFSSDGVTRESILDPENIAYWERIGWTPKIEEGWKKAYKIFDQVVARD